LELQEALSLSIS